MNAKVSALQKAMGGMKSGIQKALSKTYTYAKPEVVKKEAGAALQKIQKTEPAFRGGLIKRKGPRY